MIRCEKCNRLRSGYSRQMDGTGCDCLKCDQCNEYYPESELTESEVYGEKTGELYCEDCKDGDA